MTFRRRIALLAGLSFLAAVVACSIAGFGVVRRVMLDAVDRDLRARVEDPLGQPELAGLGAPRRPGAELLAERRARRSPTDVLYQSVTPAGAVAVPPNQADELPVDESDRRLAASERGVISLRTVRVDGERYRMITASTGRDLAVQIARPLSEVDETLARFGLSMVVVSVIGAVLAGAVGWYVARRAARPVEELSSAAERVTGSLGGGADPDLRLDLTPRHDDEIGQLTTSIAGMLAALEESREQQQRLVVDASHEFRTPMTALRANAELLERADLDPSTRAAVVRDVREEIDQLSELSAELVELATDRRRSEAPSDVSMDEIVARVAERARRRTGQRIDVSGGPWTLVGRPAMLERAVQNLVDNACKWSPPGQPVEITIEPGELQVRDHGPGIPPDQRARIFERFYRAPGAQAKPGSGLGLAIVRQVVEAHDGTVEVRDAPDGGALFVLRLPPGGMP